MSDHVFQEQARIRQMFNQLACNNGVKRLIQIHRHDIGMSHVVALRLENLNALLVNINPEGVAVYLADFTE